VEELPRLLSGDLRWTSGRLDVREHSFRSSPHPRDLIRAGITTIQADRLRAGGVPSLTVRENIVLPALRRYWHRGALRRRVVDSVIEAFDVRPPRPDAIFGSLSGGNQQKVLLGKWLLLRPSVLVLGDPTYGVDPAAREAIFEAVQHAAERGVSVLFFSTEPEQLIRVCTRVLVLRSGKVAADLDGSDLTLENVVEWSEQ
jgi:ABC-type sugar transport system ATPase subunit